MLRHTILAMAGLLLLGGTASAQYRYETEQYDRYGRATLNRVRGDVIESCLTRLREMRERFERHYIVAAHAISIRLSDRLLTVLGSGSNRVRWPVHGAQMNPGQILADDAEGEQLCSREDRRQ